MFPFTIPAFSCLRRRYSPLNGIMRGNLEQPDNSASLSDCRPPQVNAYFALTEEPCLEVKRTG